MASARDLNRKIASLRNMQKVMSAMNMIASTKLRKQLKPYEALVSFGESFLDISRKAALALRETSHPAVVGYGRVRKKHAIAITGDRGLCGSHNSSITREIMVAVKEYEDKNCTASFCCIGSKGADFCRRKELETLVSEEISSKKLSDKRLHEIADTITAKFVNNEIHEVEIIYNHFISTLKQETRRIAILPMCAILNDIKKEGGTPELEPEPDRFVPEMLKLYLFFMIKHAVLQSSISEQAARMTAMENATSNAGDLIHRYGKIRNRLRQTVITNELIEIVAGKEALKS